MLHPSYKEMIEKINDTRNEEDMEIKSRYSLVIAAAKRARQINSGSEPLVPSKRKEKNLSVAVDELYAGRVHILDENAVVPEYTGYEEYPEEDAPEETPEESPEEESGDLPEDAEDQEVSGEEA